MARRTREPGERRSSSRSIQVGLAVLVGVMLIAVYGWRSSVRADEEPHDDSDLRPKVTRLADGDNAFGPLSRIERSEFARKKFAGAYRVPWEEAIGVNPSGLPFTVKQLQRTYEYLGDVHPLTAQAVRAKGFQVPLDGPSSLGAGLNLAVECLMLEADIARLSGDPARALERALETVELMVKVRQGHATDTIVWRANEARLKALNYVRLLVGRQAYDAAALRAAADRLEAPDETEARLRTLYVEYRADKRYLDQFENAESDYLWRPNATARLLAEVYRQMIRNERLRPGEAPTATPREVWEREEPGQNRVGRRLVREMVLDQKLFQAKDCTPAHAVTRGVMLALAHEREHGALPESLPDLGADLTYDAAKRRLRATSRGTGRRRSVSVTIPTLPAAGSGSGSGSGR